MIHGRGKRREQGAGKEGKGTGGIETARARQGKYGRMSRATFRANFTTA